MTQRFAVPAVLVVVAALVYPLAVVAGGAPRFPSRSDCVHTARADGDLEVVFGYFDSEADAKPLLDKVLAVGFKGSQLELNACGQVKVAVHGITTSTNDPMGSWPVGIRSDARGCEKRTMLLNGFNLSRTPNRVTRIRGCARLSA